MRHVLPPWRNWAFAALALFSGCLCNAQAAAPAAPSLAKVTITKPSTSSVQWISVEWQDNATTETGYQIRVRLGRAGPFFTLGYATVGPDSTQSQFAINAQAVGAILQFQVFATTGDPTKPSGYSPASNVAEVIVPADKFDAPTNFTATAKDGGLIELKWTDNSTTEEGFAVELKKDGETTFTYLGYAGFNSTSVNISGYDTEDVTGNVEQFRIRALKNVNNIPAVDAVNAALATAYAPVASARVRNIVTSDPFANVYWGEAFSMDVTTSHPDLRTDLTVTDLPPGLTFDSNTNKITGTPTTVGTFKAKVTATFASLSEVIPAEIAFSIMAPAVTSRAFEPATVGSAFSFEVMTSSSTLRTSLVLSSLPPGLSYDSDTRILSGTPTQAGVYQIPITATFTGYPTQVTGSMTLRIRPPVGAPTDVPGASLYLSVPEGAACSVNLAGLFYDPDAAEAARLETNLGNIDVLLYPDSTPQTVANFLKYVDAGDYDGTAFHRAIPNFIVQGGGFVPAAPTNKFFSVPARPSPINEPGISNLRGTVAMAKIGGLPNSATTNFFFNLDDNSENLDNQNEGFTTFGRVSAPSLAVMDALAAKPTKTYSVVIDGASAQSFTDWPVNADTAPASMDNTKMLVIQKAERLPVLAYAFPSDPNSDVASISLNEGILTIQGLKPGTKDFDIEITDLDGNKITRTLHATVGQVVPYFETENAPAVNATVFQYESGTAATLAPAVTGTETAFRWLKNGVPVSKATSATLAFPSIKLTNAGAYRRIATMPGGSEVATDPMLVGVLEFSRAPLTVKAGSKVVLSAKVAGPGFSIVWAKNWSLLSEIPGKISGSSTPQLTISSIAEADAGTYQCALHSPAGIGLIIPRSVVVLTGGPVINDVYLAPVDVNHQTSYQLNWDSGQTVAPVRFTVTGLPKGMTFNTLTGVISGTPTVSGNYTITVTGINAFGSGQKKTFLLTVNPVPAGSVGTFTSVVPRDAALNGGLGGVLTVTSGANGGYSGKFVLGSSTYPFSGILTTGTGITPQFDKSIVLKNGTQMQAHVILNGSILTATLTGGTASPLNLTGAKSITPTAAFVALFNTRISIPAGDPCEGNISLMPQGHGYLALSVDSKGSIKITGKMANGTPVLASSSFGFGGKIPLRFVFASKKDVLLGTAAITQTGSANPLLSGTVEWFVASGAAKPPIFPASFEHATLEWKGAKYTPPAAIILGLPDGANNAALSFFEAGLAGENADPNMVLRITSTNSILYPPANPAFVFLKLDPAKGTFSGTFQLTDTVAGKPLVRKPAFQGLLIPGSGGFGYFLLPKLPDSSTLPALSGAVELAAP